jgi:hypothetical protein
VIRRWEDALEEALRRGAIPARQEELSDGDLENAAMRLRSGVLAAGELYDTFQCYYETVCQYTP